MGTSKAHKFSNSQNDLANIARVLGHPARIAILEQLLNKRSCNCNDLVRNIGLAQATISQHLKVLKDMGLVIGITSGKSISYSVHQNMWQECKAKISDFFINSSSS